MQESTMDGSVARYSPSSSSVSIVEGVSKQQPCAANYNLCTLKER